MGLLDDFKSEGQRPRMQCRIVTVREEMTADEHADLIAALGNPVISAAAIERVLKRKGIDVPQGTVTRHRRGECSCGK